jgi:hypothetical protein
MLGSAHMPPDRIRMPQVGMPKSPALPTSFRMSGWHEWSSTSCTLASKGKGRAISFGPSCPQRQHTRPQAWSQPYKVRS